MRLFLAAAVALTAVPALADAPRTSVRPQTRPQALSAPVATAPGVAPIAAETLRALDLTARSAGTSVTEPRTTPAPQAEASAIPTPDRRPATVRPRARPGG